MKTWYNKNQEQIEKYKYFIMLNLEHDELKELSKKDKVVERYMEDYERFLKQVNSNMFFKHKRFNDFYTYYRDMSNEKSLEYI